MTEHFFRHGDLHDDRSRASTIRSILEEPMVRTQTWRWNPNGNMAFGNPFEAVDELGDKPLGWVPFFPMGVTQPEYAEAHGLPFDATRGGKEIDLSGVSWRRFSR